MATTETTKQVAKKEANDLALTAMNQEELEAWGSDVGDTTELLIPKAILMQAVSELVQDGTCASGDIIRSTDKKVLGNAKKAITVIPFSMTRTWIETQFKDGMFKWDSERAWNAENANDPWEYEAPGSDGRPTKWKRQKAYNFYALLTDEKDPIALPIIKLQFKSGSIKAGIQLADFFARLSVTNAQRKMQKLAPLPPAYMTWKLTSKLIDGDKNKYQAFIIEQGTQSTKEQINEAASWYLMMRQNPKSVKEHNEEENSSGVAIEGDQF